MKEMRCRKHPTDFSSAVGVCAPCLRERLFATIAAQAQKQSLQDPQKSDTQQSHPLPFPRSVSPYISRRKSDTAAAAASTWQNGHRQRFYSTPQMGTSGLITVESRNNGRKSKGGRFSSLFFGLFKSKSRKSDLDSGPISDPAAPIDSHRASPSWFSSMVSGSRKNKMLTFSLVEGLAVGRNRDTGMPQASYSDAEDDEHCRGGSSGYSSETSQGWKQTPRRTPAGMGKGGGGAAPGNSRNLSAFCLSPLVRPSPNRHWSQKGMPPETVVSGESRVPPKSHLSTAPSFCKNRSRKLADIGRYNYNPHY